MLIFSPLSAQSKSANQEDFDMNAPTVNLDNFPPDIAAQIRAQTPADPRYLTPEAWSALTADERQAALSRPTRKRFNKQDNESIGWA